MIYEITIEIYGDKEIKFQRYFDTIFDVQRLCNSIFIPPVQLINGFTVNTKDIKCITYSEVKEL